MKEFVVHSTQCMVKIYFTVFFEMQSLGGVLMKVLMLVHAVTV